MNPPESTDLAAAIADQYARRHRSRDALRYSLFDAAALQAHQERMRVMVALWRVHGWRTLAERRITEVGCGAGGNLLDMLRLGVRAEHLTGIDLLPERVRAARACLPESVILVEGDAAKAPVPAASQDAVLAFTVFSSLLEEATQARLADAMWSWVRPGGGVLWHDFLIDNPRNPDVRGVPLRRLRALFPEARLVVRRVTLAPPLARALARVHPRLVGPLAACMPFLKTHCLVWALKS